VLLGLEVCTVVLGFEVVYRVVWLAFVGMAPADSLCSTGGELIALLLWVGEV
jgi:hypothetical protein